MATLDELHAALQRADAAGDTEAAKAIAQMYAQQMQAGSAPAKTSDTATPVPPRSWNPDALASGIKQAAIGAAASVPGLPGNMLELGRKLPDPVGFALQQLGMDKAFSNPSVLPKQNLSNPLPTSTDIENLIGGTPANGTQFAQRFLGSILGPTLYAKAGNAVGNVARLAMNSAPPSPEAAALAQKASDLGVPIRPAQTSSSGFVKTADDTLSRLPMTGYTADSATKISAEAQHEAFTRAVSRTFGEDAPALTQDVMASAKSRIGKIYDEVLPRNSIGQTPDLATQLSDIKANAIEQLDAEGAKDITAAVDKINDKLGTATGMSGRYYQTMRAQGGRLSKLSDAQDSTVAYYGTKLRNLLDDAFVSQAQGSDGARLAEARAQFRNLKTVEPLAAKAPTGQISPALLLGEVRSQFPNFATEGAGDLGDLARIGQQFLKTPPNSGTAERSFVLKLATDPLAAAKQAIAAPVAGTIGRAMGSALNATPKVASGAQINNLGTLDPRLVAMMAPQILARLLGSPLGQP